MRGGIGPAHRPTWVRFGARPRRCLPRLQGASTERVEVGAGPTTNVVGLGSTGGTPPDGPQRRRCDAHLDRRGVPQHLANIIVARSLFQTSGAQARGSAVDRVRTPRHSNASPTGSGPQAAAAAREAEHAAEIQDGNIRTRRRMGERGGVGGVAPRRRRHPASLATQRARRMHACPMWQRRTAATPAQSLRPACRIDEAHHTAAPAPLTAQVAPAPTDRRRNPIQRPRPRARRPSARAAAVLRAAAAAALAAPRSLRPSRSTQASS
jgi:hypothetical protein